jgi:Flp pilus assembly protein TadD
VLQEGGGNAAFLPLGATMFNYLQTYFNERVLLNALAGGDYAKAERALARLERLEGRSRRVVHNLGVVRMGQGDYAAAEALFEQQVEDYGDNAALLRALSEAAYLGGDRVHAGKRIAAALADPDCPDRPLMERRAAICADAASHAQAMDGKKEFAAGLELTRKGDKDAAIAAFRRAVEADDSDFVALNNLGALLMNHAKDYEGAAVIFEKALALTHQALMRDNLAKAREAAKMAKK